MMKRKSGRKNDNHIETNEEELQDSDKWVDDEPDDGPQIPEDEEETVKEKGRKKRRKSKRRKRKEAAQVVRI